MRQTDKSEIRDLVLFRDMSEPNFDALMNAAYVQNFPTHVELIAEGERSDFLHILINGRAELVASWKGRETTMAIVQPISTFILAATIKDAPYLMTAKTLEKSRVVLLPSQDVRDIFEADNAFARATVSALASSYREVIKTTKGLKLRTSVERLANYLLSECESKNLAAHFSLSVEKKRVASFLGMSPENLSRSIKTLRSHGVAVDGLNVEIHDMAALMHLADPSPLIDDRDY